MSNYSLELKELTKYYAKEVAINNLSINFDKAEAVIVSGSNGAGKSTLLAMLAGLIRPDSGVLTYFSNYSFAAGSGAFPKDLPAKIAYLGQKANLYLNLSVLENLELIAACKKVNTADLWKLIECLVLKDFLSKKLIECSQGVQKKAAIARALLGEAELFLLDEPYANLDRASCDRLSELLFQLNQLGKTVILVSHLDGPAKDFAERELVLEKGKLLN